MSKQFKMPKKEQFEKPKQRPKNATYFEQVTEQLNEDGNFNNLKTVRKNIRGIEPEEEFVKMTRYIVTIFAYHGIPLKLVPITLIFTQRMGFGDNMLILLKAQKEEIAYMLDKTLQSIDQLIHQCRKYDIIRPTGSRGIYEVNWFLFGTGSNEHVRINQARFDFMANQVTVLSESHNKITGESVRRAVYNYNPKNQKQIPGQMSIDDFIEGDATDEE